MRGERGGGGIVSVGRVLGFDQLVRVGSGWVELERFSRLLVESTAHWSLLPLSLFPLLRPRVTRDTIPCVGWWSYFIALVSI